MHWNSYWWAALGNSALILPLLAGVVALLATQSADGRHDARRWLLASGVAFSAMALSKIAFYGWGIGIHPLRLASPSGHATLAMAFWPVFLALLAPAEQRSWRNAGIAIGFAVGLLCSVSRVASHAHTLSEAIVGAAVGATVALVTLKGLRTQHLPLTRAVIGGALLLCVLLAWSSGRALRLPSERWLARVGAHLAGREAPVSKSAWLRTGEIVDEPRPRHR